MSPVPGPGEDPHNTMPDLSMAPGEVRVERQVMITVPPGTETGTKVRLKGQGGRRAWRTGRETCW